jgi:hypothetical protein
MALLLSLYHSNGRWFISNLAESLVLLRATTRGGPREPVSALRPALPRCELPDSIVDLGLAGHAAAPGDCGPFRGPAPGSAGPEAPHGENLRGRSASPTGPYAALREAFGHEPDQLPPPPPDVTGVSRLWCGDPDATNVSEAARRYGFRGLGRLAGAYRHLFGGLPSASLRWSLHPGMAHLAAPGMPAAWETVVASASDLDRRRDEAIDYDSFQLLKRRVRALAGGYGFLRSLARPAWVCPARRGVSLSASFHER